MNEKGGESALFYHRVVRVTAVHTNHGQYSLYQHRVASN